MYCLSHHCTAKVNTILLRVAVLLPLQAAHPHSACCTVEMHVLHPAMGGSTSRTAWVGVEGSGSLFYIPRILGPLFNPETARAILGPSEVAFCSLPGSAMQHAACGA